MKRSLTLVILTLLGASYSPRLSAAEEMPLVVASFASEADAPPTYAVREVATAMPVYSRRVIPLRVETNRMRGLNFDEKDIGWAALVESDRRRILKLDLGSGKVEDVLVTDQPSSDKLYMDNVVPVGDELFVCGGWYPRQIILDPKTGKARELELKVENPEIFNATVVDGKIYAFDGNNGIHVWVPGTWTCDLVPWPMKGKGPFVGVHVKADDAFYCPMWWQQGMAPTQPLLRFDLKKRTWATIVPPWPNTKPMTPVEVSGKLYLTDMFGGYMLVFDIQEQRFVARHALPGHGMRWQYAASFNAFGPYIDCPLSTFAGVPNDRQTFGFDGHAHHFVGDRLLFDTRDGSALLVPVPSLSGAGYVTTAYSQVRGDSLFLTCVDSPKEDGRPTIERGQAYLVEWKLHNATRSTP